MSEAPTETSSAASVVSDPDSARWRRLRAMVDARVFGDAPPSVGRYRLLHALGSGAMGVVFSALDTELQREVAIKLLGGHADQDQRRRLQREAQAIARVSHPNVVGVYDVGEHDGEFFVAMELVVGRTLRAWLDDGPHSWRDIARVFAAAARGLAAAHAAGLVHRDFKPENVLIDARGRVCVVDFGLVTRGAHSSDPLAADARATLAMDVGASIPQAGTPAYMAPEQIVGRPVDARADAWSLCVALFEALYRRRPFDRDTVVGTLAAVVRGEIAWPRSHRHVPRRLQSLLRRGLQHDRDRRTLDCEAIARELDAAASARRRFGIAAGATTMAVALALLTARALAGAANPCDEAESALADTWNDERHRTVVARLAGHGTAQSEAVGLAIDEYAVRWREQLAGSCDGALDSAGVLAARLCLQGQRESLAATVGLLVDADLAIARNHGQLLAALADPSLCADARTRPELVIDDGPPERSAVWRTELARARALWNAGDDEGAAALARASFAAAEQANAWAVVADAGVLLGEIASLRVDDLTPIIPTIVSARSAAARAGWQSAIARTDALLTQDPYDARATTLERRFAAARAEAESTQDVEALALLAIATHQLGARVFGLDDASATALVGQATELARARLGGGHRLVRELERPSRLRQRAPNVVTARALLTAAITSWGPDASVVANHRLSLAVALKEEKLYPEAIAEQLAATMEFRSMIHGHSSVEYLDAATGLFALQAEAGQIADAIATAERLIADLEGAPRNPRAFGPAAASVADGVAQLLLRTGDPLRAVGFAERATTEPDRFRRIPYQLTLAEALIRTGELERAETLVTQMWDVIHEPEPTIAPVSTQRARIRLARAEVSANSGREDEAEQDLRAALPDLLSTMPREHVHAHLALAGLGLRRGDEVVARPELDAADAVLAELVAADPLRAELATLRSQLAGELD